MSAGAHPAMNGEQQFGRSAVGAMNGEGPAAKFSAPGGDAAEPFGLHKFDTPGIREAFLRRIYDLHDMTARAVGGELTDGAAKFRDRAPQIRYQQHFRKR